MQLQSTFISVMNTNLNSMPVFFTYATESRKKKCFLFLSFDIKSP